MIHTSNLPQVRTLRHTEAMEVLRSPLDVMRAVWAPFVYDLRSSGEPDAAGIEPIIKLLSSATAGSPETGAVRDRANLRTRAP